MANRIRIKRTGSLSQVPGVEDLLVGELAINYAEGKLFALKDDGSQSVVTIGEDLGSEGFADRIRDIIGYTNTFEFLSSVQSTSKATGAVVVTGGVGVGGNVVIGGILDGATIDCGTY